MIILAWKQPCGSLAAMHCRTARSPDPDWHSPCCTPRPVVHVGETYDVVTVFLRAAVWCRRDINLSAPRPTRMVTKTDGEFLPSSISTQPTASRGSAIVWNRPGFQPLMAGRLPESW